MSLETLPALDGLSDVELSRFGDVSLVRSELMAVITNAISNRPRSLQRTVGPSELGTPCIRKLASRLSGIDHFGYRAAWRPTVGTAVHAWLAETFEAYNAHTGFLRYLTELTVDVGQVNDMTIRGSVDLYDRVTCTVIDWKIVGTTSLRKARSQGPSDTYRTQVQLYGRGIRNRGVPADTVAVMYLPVSGELSQSVFCPMPFDESVALAALHRTAGLDYALKQIGPRALIPTLPTAEDFCLSCPWFRPGLTDPLACDGRTDGDLAHAEATQLKGVLL